MGKYTLHINDKTHEVEVPGDMPLLWVLRDVLALKGTKYGCGEALCGACKVLLNDESVPSCVLQVSQVRDAKIITIEGLSQNGDHPLQEAWVKHVVPQCGYCQTGQLMSAAALLIRNPTPSDAQIESAMSGNLCRCGTYNRIKDAIKTASNALDPNLPVL